MGETFGYFVDPKSGQAVLEVLTKYLGIEISFNELEAKAKQIDQITSKLKDIEAAPEPPDKREDLGYIGSARREISIRPTGPYPGHRDGRRRRAGSLSETARRWAEGRVAGDRFLDE